MRTMVMSVLAATALVTWRSAMLAAPEQTTQRPGEMTQARVWIENREPREAIPVTVQDVSRDLAPLRVRVVNMQNAPVFEDPVRTRRAPQTWEYRTVVLTAAGPAVATQALNDLGLQGWETTGVTLVGTQGTTTILLKRPRP